MKAFEEWWTSLGCGPPVTRAQQEYRDGLEDGWRAALERVVKQMNLNPYMDNGELRTWIKQELGEN